MRSVVVGAVVSTALLVLTSVLLGRISVADPNDQQAFTPIAVSTEPTDSPDDPDLEPADDPDDADRPSFSADSAGSSGTAQRPERVQPRPRKATCDRDSNPSVDSAPSSDSPPSADT